MDDKSYYPIRAVAKLVGMTTDSIRAWERRYGAVTPKRSRGGRLYSDDDVQRLKMLKRAVDQGHSIGQIASLDQAGLRSLPLEHAHTTESQAVRKRYEERQIDAVFECLLRYDAPEADRILGYQASLLPPRDFVYALVLPLMQKVGAAWVEGTVTIAQEHMLSTILRNVLGTLLRVNSNGLHRGRILFTSLPGERHEFGLLSAAMLATGYGFRALYIGPDMPLSETITALKKTESAMLVISLVSSEDKTHAHLKYLRDLDKEVQGSVDIVLGGSLSDEVVDVARDLKYVVMTSMEAFESHLRRYSE